LLAKPVAAAEDRVVVFAAASLKNALDKVNTACEAEAGGRATISYAATSALAKQIQEGAPADVFFAADVDWMDKLADGKLIRPETAVKLLGNEIVLVAPAGSSASIAVAPGFDLAGLIGDGRLAMANVDAVPAGKYGRASLEKLGVWESVKGRIAQAENVRAALALVAIGEAPLGIVYRTDARAEAKVKVIAAFPADSHPPIIYPVAQTTASTASGTPAFLTCLASSKAKEVFEAEGFVFLGAAATN
jgi:molybdate transport system substrate-binding protein